MYHYRDNLFNSPKILTKALQNGKAVTLSRIFFEEEIEKTNRRLWFVLLEYREGSEVGLQLHLLPCIPWFR